MFGLFKSKPAPEGPVAFQFSAEIDCPPGELYRIIDYADEKCWKRDVGSIDQTGAGSYRMVLEMLPDVAFKLDVTEAEPGKSYVYDCTADPKIGRLIVTTESYDLEASESGGSNVTISVVAEFDADMTEQEWQQEVEMMALGVNNSLNKLKVHAEMGVEKIREIEAVQIAGMCDTRH